MSLGVLSTWNRKQAISCTRGFLFRHSNGNAENQEVCGLSEFYLVIYDPCSPLAFRSGFAHGPGEGKMSSAPPLYTVLTIQHILRRTNRKRDKTVGKEGKFPLTTGCADSRKWGRRTETSMKTYWCLPALEDALSRLTSLLSQTPQWNQASEENTACFFKVKHIRACGL